jgi:hypothetical protein
MGADISLAATILLTAFAAWDGLWQYVADEARTALLRPVPAREAAVAVDHAMTSLSQGAARTLLTLHGVGVTGSVRGQTWEWRVGEVVVALSGDEPDRLEVVLPAPQHLASDGPLGRAAVTLWAGNLRAALLLAADGTVRAVSVTGDGLTVEAPGLEARARQLALATERREGGAALDLELAEVTLPEALHLGPPMGGRVERAALSGWVEGLGPPFPETATAWRAAAGLVGISELRVLWGPLDLRLDGRAGLDEALRPVGDARVALAGVGGALESLHAAGLISDAWREATRKTLARLGELRGEDAVDDLAFSVSMAGGLLRWSGLPVAILPAFGAPSDAARCTETEEGAAPAC